MKQAVADWKTRQAGDDEPASGFVAPSAEAQDTVVVTTGYTRRRAWCSGGEYVVRDRTEQDERDGFGPKGTPIIAKARECQGPVVYPTDLCESCARRERDVRDRLRSLEAKAHGPQPQTQSRSRWTR